MLSRGQSGCAACRLLWHCRDIPDNSCTGVPDQALCTEASLAALRRTYPQIYDSDDKLLIDPARVAVTPRDFLAAHAAVTPASHRSAAAHAR